MNNFEIISDFNEYMRIFLEQNSKLNLISKNDEKYLYEKHIYDSLAIKLFFDKYSIKNVKILDIGCGGGFPSVPIAIEYPNCSVIGVDSIRKKINAVNEIKESLNLSNLNLICDRVENLKDKYNVIVSRAVAELKKIVEYAIPRLKDDGYLVIYKSRKALKEIDFASGALKKANAQVVDILEYTLPLEEVFERNLVIIKKIK